MTGLAIAAAALGAATLGALVASACYERELRRTARDLERRDPAGGERVRVTLRSRGMLALARAVNGVLDAAQRERSEELARRRAFREDLSSLAHDIRTPLAAAQGYLQLHERDTDEALRARRLSQLGERLGELRELTEQLFAYAKASSPDVALRTQDVRVFDVLAQSLAALYPEFERRGWEPRLDFPDEGLTVHADAKALGRVFSNLLANALRHGTTPPSVVQRGCELRFANRVADPGAIDVGRLFERFYRADPGRTGPGSGLGLAIVASLARAMGMGVRAELAGDELAVVLTLGGGMGDAAAEAGGPHH